LSLAQATSTCCFSVASCSVNSWITVSFTGPSRHCYVMRTTWSSSAPWLSTSVNNRDALSFIGWSRWVTSITLIWIIWI
jgi:hypothetical protein